MGGLALILTVERGPNRGERIPVKETITVGRQADNTLVIADDSLSRHHARFEFQGNALLVTDLGSANGTRVNGHPISGSPPTISWSSAAPRCGCRRRTVPRPRSPTHPFSPPRPRLQRT